MGRAPWFEARRLALRLIESDRYSRLPKVVQRWAFRRTSVTDRTRRNQRKYADILERLGK